MDTALLTTSKFILSNVCQTKKVDTSTDQSTSDIIIYKVYETAFSGNLKDLIFTMILLSLEYISHHCSNISNIFLINHALQ